MNGRNVSFYATVLFLSFTFSIIAFTFFIVEFVTWRSYIQQGLHSKGTIINVYEKDQGDGGITIVAEIQYSVNNQSYYINNKVNNAFKPNEYEIGDEIDILYLEERPDEGRINSFTEIYFSLGVIFTLGLTFLITGMLTIRFKSWIMKQKGDVWPSG